jgi:thymidylate synthase (FAD)
MEKLTQIDTKDGKGHIILLDYMGNDLHHVNAARASFGKRSEELKQKDAKLLQYLAEHKHTAPFRHSYVSLQIKAPLFVLRQWFKHVVGSQWYESRSGFVDTPWSEMSMRYVSPEEVWEPEYFRVIPDNKKQGSIDVPHKNNEYWLELYRNYVLTGLRLYDSMVADGVAPEQARTLLGLNVYSNVVWTASFQAISHFVSLRDDSHAQKEIQEYAQIVSQIMQELFPYSWKVFNH